MSTVAQGQTDRPEIDEALAGRLLRAQFPHWADLPLRRLEPAGSDHVIYRLGTDLSVRLPRGSWAAGQAVKEHRWLPRLAAGLPLAVPVPLGLGEPAFGYPWHWSVNRWLEGSPATVEGLADRERTAVRLAEFLTALQRLTPASSWAPGAHPELVGDVLETRDEATRAAVVELSGLFDAEAMTEVWEAALRAPRWNRGPVWFHGDFHTGNLLTEDGQLSAVIDFGGLGSGDPFGDLMIAYTLLDAETRPLFRAALDVDEATWVRGRGWALATGLNAYRHYAETDPRVARQTRRQVTEVLAEYAHG